MQNNILNYNYEFHCTICDSTIDVNFSLKKPISDIKFIKWDYWTDSKNNRILVAIIESKYLQFRFEQLKLLGIQTNFTKLNAHITLSYNVEDYSYNLPHLPFPLEFKRRSYYQVQIVLPISTSILFFLIRSLSELGIFVFSIAGKPAPTAWTVAPPCRMHGPAPARPVARLQTGPQGWRVARLSSAQ